MRNYAIEISRLVVIDVFSTVNDKGETINTSTRWDMDMGTAKKMMPEFHDIPNDIQSVIDSAQ